MKKLTVLAFALAASCGVAQASVIKVEAASGTTNFLGSANAYQAKVDAALAGASYASASPASLNAISHASLFGGNSNFAMKTTVKFGLLAASNVAFRAGVDFGSGGAMFLDGVALDFKGSDMWWNGSYSSPSQFLAGSGLLTAGNHVLTVMGFEACCDGGEQVQFKLASGAFTSFARTDDLAYIPEPATLGLAAAGLGLVGLSRRRKGVVRAA